VFVAAVVSEVISQKLSETYAVYSNGGTWHPEACYSLGLEHILHRSFEKSPIERAIQYFKDRTECFDDYYASRRYTLPVVIYHTYIELDDLVCVHAKCYD
jgi:hypothetical protein